MTIKPIILNLSPEETMRLTRVLLDEDKRRGPCVSKGMSEASIGSGNPGPLSAGL